jgi:hypothetical protein
LLLGYYFLSLYHQNQWWLYILPVQAFQGLIRKKLQSPAGLCNLQVPRKQLSQTFTFIQSSIQSPKSRVLQPRKRASFHCSSQRVYSMCSTLKENGGNPYCVVVSATLHTGIHPLFLNFFRLANSDWPSTFPQLIFLNRKAHPSRDNGFTDQSK